LYRFCGNEAPFGKFFALYATVTVVFSAPFSGFFVLTQTMFPFIGFRMYLKVDIKKESEYIWDFLAKVEELKQCQ
jgi:hypothetical protein